MSKTVSTLGKSGSTTVRRILIADDHHVVREGLKNIIEKTGEFVVVAEAADGHDVLVQAGKTLLHAIVLDISMPGPGGIEVLKQLKAKHPTLPVLMLSQHPEEHYAVRAMKAGASGYLTKESASGELIAAIRKITCGGNYVGESLAETIVSSLNINVDRPLHESLSDREYEILCMYGQGKTSSQIADELSLSVKTVSTYRTRILEKMNMKTTPELMLYVVQSNLISSPKHHQETQKPLPKRPARRR